MDIKKFFSDRNTINYFLLLLLVGQSVIFLHRTDKIKRRCDHQSDWYQTQIEDMKSAFEFGLKVEGRRLKQDLDFYLIKYNIYLSFEEFIERYICIFHLSELACNECFAKEFDVMSEVLKSEEKRKIAIITNSNNQEFIIKFMKDHATDIDLFQVQGGIFEQPLTIEVPFYTKFDHDGFCYSSHIASKISQDLTSIYLNNLF